MKIIGTRPVLAAALLLSGLWMPAAFAYTSGHGGGSGGHVSAGHAGAALRRRRTLCGTRLCAAQLRRLAGHLRRRRARSRDSLGRRWRGSWRHSAAPGLRGRAIGPGYGHTSHWGGGYWRGRYWPGAYYGPGFAWFLASVPLYCSTFWWNNVPYYYYNDVYYTWSPTADGYVATDPPPAAPADDGAPASAPDRRRIREPRCAGSSRRPHRMRSRRAALLPAARAFTPTRPKVRANSSRPRIALSALSGRPRRRVAPWARRIIGARRLPVSRDGATARR